MAEEDDAKIRILQSLRGKICKLTDQESGSQGKKGPESGSEGWREGRGGSVEAEAPVLLVGLLLAGTERQVSLAC